MSLDLLKHATPHVLNAGFECDKDPSPVFRCFECKRTPLEDFKMLPCLHLCCASCLTSIVEKSNIAMPQNGSSIRCSIFSCPECSYVVRIVNGDVSFLKDFVVDHEAQKKFQKGSQNLTDKMKVFKIKDGVKVRKHKESDSKKSKVCASTSEEESSKLCDFCCESAMIDDDNENLLFCLGCQTIVCQECQIHHLDHDCENLNVYVGNLKGKMEKMNKDLSQMHEGVKEKLDTIQHTKLQLRKNKEDLYDEINNRTKQLFKKIEKQKQTLLKKLDSEYEVCTENQNKSEKSLKKVVRGLEGCLSFSKHVLDDDQGTNLLNIYSDIEAHITRTFLSCQHKDMIEQLRVDWVDEGKEDRMVEKLCGSLVTGSTTFGESRTIRQFNCGLTWPTCMATNSETFVVAGRSETFETASKLLFFSVKGHQLIRSEAIIDKAIIDILPLPSSSNHFLLSTSNGSISKYSFNGDIVTTFQNIFQPPGGHMAHHTHHLFLLSTNNFSINVCKYSDSEVLNKINLTSPTRPLSTKISASTIESTSSTQTITPPANKPHQNDQKHNSNPQPPPILNQSSPPSASSSSLSSSSPSLSESPLIRGLTSNTSSICTILEDNSFQIFSLTGDYISSSNHSPSNQSLSNHSSKHLSSSPTKSSSTNEVLTNKNPKSLSSSKNQTNSTTHPPSSQQSQPSPSSSSPPQPSPKHHFKCPSHITTDPFNNLIVSDFTNDSISLLTSDGSFMGFLLSKPTISCPHRLMLDTDNHLYVAQFGGDVSVHHYLSFVRRV